MLRLAASTLTLLALLCATAAARADRVVVGLEGQPDLRLDVGRSLERCSLRGHAPVRLKPIEKARLDARRLLRASSLPRREAVERIVGIVQRRFQRTSAERYARLGEREVTRLGEARLSSFVGSHVGLCRERAFLLKAMLEEGGLPAEVRYGVLYDRRGNALGGHAWVETRIDGKPARIDPTVARPVAVGIRPIAIEDGVAGSEVRRVTGSRSRTHVYVPTDDLIIR